MMIMDWTWPTLQVKFSLLCFLWENGKTMDFSEAVVVYDF